MQEKQIVIMDQKIIASSRLATCYHPTPEGMGIRAGISINEETHETEQRHHDHISFIQLQR